MTDQAAEVTNAGKPRSYIVTLLFMTAIAALVGATMMYLRWRGFFGVPHVLSVPVHMNDQGSPVRPWAPWWVPTGIMAIVTALLWCRLAVRKQRISLWGGAFALMLASMLTYTVGAICLEVGAMMQFLPRPPVTHILMVMPLVLLGGLQLIVLSLIMGGFIMLPLAALVGAALAAIGRIVSGELDRFGGQMGKLCKCQR